MEVECTAVEALTGTGTMNYIPYFVPPIWDCPLWHESCVLKDNKPWYKKKESRGGSAGKNTLAAANRSPLSYWF
jgi:hypothetical protein